MKRVSIEPVVDRTERALEAGEGHLRDLVEEGAARARAGLHRVEERAPAVSIGRRPSGRRRWIGRLLVATTIAVVIVWWLQQRRGGETAADGRAGTDSVTGRQYRIVQSGEGGWRVVDPVDGEHHHRTQADAIASAKQLASDRGGGEIVVHGLDGQPRETISV
jgi:hypothetical protein